MFIRPSHSRSYLFIYFNVAYVALVFVFNCNRRITNVSMMMMKQKINVWLTDRIIRIFHNTITILSFCLTDLFSWQ